MLAEEARIGRQVDLLVMALVLEEPAGLVLTDAANNAAHSLEDLDRAVAGRLYPAADCEARAAELVAEAAGRAHPGCLARRARTCVREGDNSHRWSG
jgi:hypothetical protein